MKYQVLDYVSIILGIALNLACTVVMIRKRLVQALPMVTLRSGLNAVVDAAAVVSVLCGGWHYREIYYAGWLVVFGIELLALNEVTRASFADFRLIQRGVFAAVLLALSVAFTTVVPHTFWRIGLDHALAAFECILLCYLAVYLFLRGRTWQGYSHMFVMCFGAAACARGTIAIIEGYVRWSRALDELSIVLQLIALTAWFLYLLQPQRACSMSEREKEWLESSSKIVRQRTRALKSGTTSN